jgi:hypothetical protein
MQISFHGSRLFLERHENGNLRHAVDATLKPSKREEREQKMTTTIFADDRTLTTTTMSAFSSFDVEARWRRQCISFARPCTPGSLTLNPKP